MSRAVPVIDIEPFRNGTDPASVVAAVDQSCRNTGFLVITGHGIDPAVTAEAMTQIQEFFDQPTGAKAAFRNESRGSGYYQFANMALARSNDDHDAPPDLREELRVRRLDVIDWRSPLWNGDDRLRDGISAYYAAMDELADTVMEIFALALGRPAGFFRQFTNRHDSQLGIYHYPPMTEPPLPGQLRGGAHTDFGSLTLLHGSPSVHGLQVWTGEEWEYAPVVDGSIVINIGDLMQRWTNDQWNSTLHRVANPVEGDWDKARYSLAFFHQPHHDAVISSLDNTQDAKYPAITSGEHFQRKLDALALA
ncbi:isopenicillin N synthase family oxygenase [Rhodococcus sp. GA1]|uniref:isopenicillin N synthase family dioxygenase n=1 Tax=Rhodococcus sp. GA1 TaxID=2942275 RepID=UPI0020CE94A5|nr:2OG-Fe(II) oxygenase family protein [Rhodococcus sp. GA1]